MSNRLESLNSKKAPKPGLKFKPKVVARKSKEDRDKEAPVVKVEDTARLPTSSRGRATTRGRGRGRGGAYVGTHLVSSGPLAQGTVDMGGGRTTSKTGLTANKVYGTGESKSSVSMASMKLKSREPSEGPVEDGDSDGDDPTRINMNKEYAFDDADTVLFPVQPQKNADSLLEPTLAYGEAVSASNSRAASHAPSGSPVKVEDSDGSPTPPVVDVSDEFSAAEHDKLIDDQRSIVDLVTAQLDAMKTDSTPSDRDGLMLFHIPKVTPTEGATATPTSKFASANAANFHGHIGQLNFHQSGKITISLADGTSLECAKGAPFSFLQEVYVVDSQEDAKSEDGSQMAVLNADGEKLVGNIHRLGDVSAKIVATPSIQY